jgi:hypothetical protein
MHDFNIEQLPFDCGVFGGLDPAIPFASYAHPHMKDCNFVVLKPKVSLYPQAP